MTLGEEWYREFWDRFQSYAATHRARYEGTTTDAKWSKFMFSFLSDMAEQLGYEQQKEEPGFGARRFDRIWRRGGDTVVLEHENWGVKYALEDEVRKLADRKGDLHVCITYLPASRFPGKEYAEQCQHILGEEGFEDEFLFVLGENDMASPTNWVCHRIVSEPTLKTDVLVLPSPSVASTRRTGRHRTRGEPGRESGWEIMKRQLPNSKAVEYRLRKAIKAGRGESYIRTLRSLKGYWERRGK